MIKQAGKGKNGYGIKGLAILGESLCVGQRNRFSGGEACRRKQLCTRDWHTGFCGIKMRGIMLTGVLPLIKKKNGDEQYTRIQVD